VGTGPGVGEGLGAGVAEALPPHPVASVMTATNINEEKKAGLNAGLKEDLSLRGASRNF